MQENVKQEGVDATLNSMQLGSYRPNTLLIKINSIADIDGDCVHCEELAEGEVCPTGEDCGKLVEPMPAALATHVHEYIHYLHNFTTYTGVMQFVVAAHYLRYFAWGVDGSGDFIPEQVPPEILDTLKQISSVLDDIGGKAWAVPRTPVKTRASLEWTISVDDVIDAQRPPFSSITTVTGSVKSGALTEPFGFQVGHTFITEGIAYCVDREVRRMRGVEESELDKGVSVFPYLTFKPVIEHLMGREVSPAEEVAIGVCALMGFSLQSACAALRTQEDVPGHAVKLINSIATQRLNSISEKAFNQCMEWRSEFSENDHLYSALSQFMSLIQKAYELRVVKPILEEEFFAKPLRRQRYQELIASMLDACVMQLKPGREAELRWEGSDDWAHDINTATNLGVLQASLHFVQLHLKRNNQVPPTKDVHPTRCPFSGSCEQEKNMKDEICLERPWHSFRALKGDKLCWYAAGVSILAGRKYKPDAKSSG